MPFGLLAFNSTNKHQKQRSVRTITGIDLQASLRMSCSLLEMMSLARRRGFIDSGRDTRKRNIAYTCTFRRIGRPFCTCAETHVLVVVIISKRDQSAKTRAPRNLDILAFSDTWLNNSISSDDLLLQQYHPPERKDRVGDSHVGVIIYVRENIHYTRRRDLEPKDIGCLWIELTCKKHVLFALFYRPQAQRLHTSLQ